MCALIKAGLSREIASACGLASYLAGRSLASALTQICLCSELSLVELSSMDKRSPIWKYFKVCDDDNSKASEYDIAWWNISKKLYDICYE